jgi:hypothetical protein
LIKVMGAYWSSAVSTTTVDPDDLLPSQTLVLVIDDDLSLLAPGHYANEGESVSVPREVISETISTCRFQYGCLQSLITGKYNGIPAYLLQLQFQFTPPEHCPTWLSRIQSASIDVVFEDVPANTPARVNVKTSSRAARREKEANSPEITGTFPGPDGWKIPFSDTPPLSTSGVGIQQISSTPLGSQLATDNIRSKPETEGTALTKVTTLCNGYPRLNHLEIDIRTGTEKDSIPELLAIPLIMTPKGDRPFNMRVRINAKVDIWKGELFRTVKISGQAEKPLYFDPIELQRMKEGGIKSTQAQKVVEMANGNLEEIDLKSYFTCSRG